MEKSCVCLNMSLKVAKVVVAVVHGSLLKGGQSGSAAEDLKQQQHY